MPGIMSEQTKIGRKRAYAMHASNQYSRSTTRGSNLFVKLRFECDPPPFVGLGTPLLQHRTHGHVDRLRYK